MTNQNMDTLLKKYVWYTFFVLAVTIACALLILSGGDLQYMTAFFHLFARYDLPGAMLLIAVLFSSLFLASKLNGSQVENILSFFQRYPFRISMIVTMVMALGAVFVYHKHPLSMDEYLPYFQSRIFAEGKLWGQFPTELVPWLLQPHFFSVFSPETGRVVSDYWPGFALLLTPFTKLNLPWLLNPVLSGGTLLLFYYYIKKILPDTSSGAWGVLLTISSSVFWVNGISFYSMSAHLFLNLVYATLLLEPTLKRIFMAGIVGSFALVLHNPVPHICFALPWIAWLGFNKQGMKNIGALIAGYLPLSLLLGFGWVWLKLEIAKGGPGIMVQGLEFVHNAAQSSIHASNPKDPNVFTLFIVKILGVFDTAFKIPDAQLLWARLLGWLKLFAWALPGLPILAILGLHHIKRNTHLKLWAWSAVVTLSVFIFIPFSQGHGWGFRYFHSVWLSLPLLGAAFLSSDSIRNTDQLKKMICVISLLALIFSTGLRFYQVHQFIGQHLSKLPVIEKSNDTIVIVNTIQGYYTQDLIQNDPFLRESKMILRSAGQKKDLEMMKEKFPGARKMKNNVSYTVWEIKKKDWIKSMKELK